MPDRSVFPQDGQRSVVMGAIVPRDDRLEQSSHASSPLLRWSAMRGHPHRFGEAWGIFAIAPRHDEAVEALVRACGVELVRGADGSVFEPQGFDDVGEVGDEEAWDLARGMGFRLVRVPDAVGSRYWSMLVAEPWPEDAIDPPPGVTTLCMPRRSSIPRSLALVFAVAGLGCQEPVVDAQGEPEGDPDCKAGTAGCRCLDSMPRCDAGCDCVGELCVPEGGAGGASSNPSGDPWEEEGDDGGDEGSQGFVPQPDWEAPEWCEPGMQDCPEGEKCTSYVMTPGYCCVDANRCVPIIGDRGLGERCVRTEDNDDCARGLFCMTATSGDTGDGVCLPYCDAYDPDSCAHAGLPGAVCAVFGDATLPLCAGGCDPLAQDCAPPYGCYAFAWGGFMCASPSHAKTMGNDGDACGAVQSCRPGLTCAPAQAQEGCEADACCTPLCECDPEQPEGVESVGCTGPEVCQCFFGGYAPPGYETFGVCASSG